MLSGIEAAEHVAAALAAGRAHDELGDLAEAWRAGPVGRDLWKVRNVKPLLSKFGTTFGMALSGLDMWANTLGFSLFGTLHHGKPDDATLEPAASSRRIVYPRPDGKLTFDRLSSVFLSNTNHEEAQPAPRGARHGCAKSLRARHLRRAVGPLLPGGGDRMGRGGRHAIRHQCAELRPLQDLRHQGSEPQHHLGTPEGGGGPNYPNM